MMTNPLGIIFLKT